MQEISCAVADTVHAVFAVGDLRYSRRIRAIFWKESRRSCPPPQVPAAIL